MAPKVASKRKREQQCEAEQVHWWTGKDLQLGLPVEIFPFVWSIFYFQAIWRWLPKLINFEFFHVLPHRHLLNSSLRKPPTSFHLHVSNKGSWLHDECVFKDVYTFACHPAVFTSTCFKNARAWLATMLEPPLQMKTTKLQRLRCHAIIAEARFEGLLQEGASPFPQRILCRSRTLVSAQVSASWHRDSAAVYLRCSMMFQGEGESHMYW